jgi:hypothetical protein
VISYGPMRVPELKAISDRTLASWR